MKEVLDLFDQAAKNRVDHAFRRLTLLVLLLSAGLVLVALVHHMLSKRRIAQGE